VPAVSPIHPPTKVKPSAAQPSIQDRHRATPPSTPTAGELPPANPPFLSGQSGSSTPDVITRLILNLQRPDPRIRNRAIWELGQNGDSRAIQPLVDLLLTSDSKQRSLILATLSEIGTRALQPMGRALTFSLQDENAEVRKNAIRDLTRIYDMTLQLNQLLQRAIYDPDPEVQETAQWALDKFSRINPGITRTDPNNFSNR
ncbi:MAG: HEAT repeat domain-containing protein, partial [Microcoleaceae cyanobacterium]